MLTENTYKSQNYLGVAEIEMWEELDKSKKPKQILRRNQYIIINNILFNIIINIRLSINIIINIMINPW